MKPSYFVKILPFLSIVGACTKPDQPQATGNDLTGSWTGANETRQTGSCSWGGEASVSTTATFRVVNNTITGTINRGIGPVSSPKQITGTINGSAVNVSESNNVVCYGTPRTYVSRYEGTISGNTVTLVSRDTLCPAQGCIFRRTLKLTRQ